MMIIKRWERLRSFLVHGLRVGVNMGLLFIEENIVVVSPKTVTEYERDSVRLWRVMEKTRHWPYNIINWWTIKRHWATSNWIKRSYTGYRVTRVYWINDICNNIRIRGRSLCFVRSAIVRCFLLYETTRPAPVSRLVSGTVALDTHVDHIGSTTNEREDNNSESTVAVWYAKCTAIKIIVSIWSVAASSHFYCGYIQMEFSEYATVACQLRCLSGLDWIK